MWSAALDAFPTVDIVVPGAGLFEPPSSSFWHAPRTATNPDTPSRDDADADRGHYAVLDVNLVSPIRLSQLAISHWTAGKQAGCLVHVGSVAGFTSAINTPLYFASKHGLHGFVRSLAALRDKMGIRVGCVAPSAVRVSSFLLFPPDFFSFVLPFLLQEWKLAPPRLPCSSLPCMNSFLIFVCVITPHIALGQKLPFRGNEGGGPYK